MGFSDFLLNIVPVILFELIAAIAGIFYLKKNSTRTNERYFVYFLWLNVLIDVLGSYAGVAYFTDYQIFEFIKGTPFRNNYWLFNIHLLLTNLFFIWFFSSEIKKVVLRKILLLLSVIMTIVVIADFYFGSFFGAISKTSAIFGSLLILLTILLFYKDLLVSEKLLKLKFYLPIYISVVLLVHTLCTSPLDFLSSYFKTSSGNHLFVSLKVSVFFFLNILLYLTYTVAFIICSKRKNLSY